MSAAVSASLEKLRQECDDVKTLIPRQLSNGSESEKQSSVSDGDRDSELETVTPLDRYVGRLLEISIVNILGSTQ